MKSDDTEYWIGEEIHQVRLSEVDMTGRMSFYALLQLMQEVAWNNSQLLNFSVYDLMKKGLTWVVHRMQFHVTSYPKHYEKLVVRSWPSGSDRLFVYRDYLVLDEQGNEIVQGTSSWLMMDVEKRKPVSVKENYPLVAPEGTIRGVLNTEKLKVIDDGISSSQIVGFADVDVNQHTNNTNYIKWGLEHVYQHLGEIQKPAYIDLIFKGESTLGDQLVIFHELGEEGSLTMTIHNQTKNKLTFQAKAQLTC